MHDAGKDLSAHLGHLVNVHEALRLAPPAQAPPRLAKLLPILSATWCGASILMIGIYFNTASLQALTYVQLLLLAFLVPLLTAVAGAYRAAFVLPTLNREARKQLRAALHRPQLEPAINSSL
jgi:hypothetical protein